MNFFFSVVITIAHPPDRRLELFFSSRNNDRAPARQMTRTFFPTRTFFSGRNNDLYCTISTYVTPKTISRQNQNN